jgi:hypothetical protein
MMNGRRICRLKKVRWSEKADGSPVGRFRIYLDTIEYLGMLFEN